MAFRVATAQCQKICPERLNWPGRLAGISEGHRGISKYFFLDHFSSSFFVYCLALKTYSEKLFCLILSANEYESTFLSLWFQIYLGFWSLLTHLKDSARNNSHRIESNRGMYLSQESEVFDTRIIIFHLNEFRDPYNSRIWS